MTAPDLTADERATLERIEAAPAADESAEERVARAMWEDVDGYMAGVPWERAGPWKQAKYRRLAAAALRPLKPAPGTDTGGAGRGRHESACPTVLRYGDCPLPLHRCACRQADAAPGTDSSGQAVQRGTDLIATERARQVEQEGWSPGHDAEHADDAMACAAAVYALPVGRRGRRSVPHPGNNGDRGDAWRYVPYQWPWDPEWYKPSPNDRVRELVKAGALIAAEIDRLRAVAGPQRDHDGEGQR